MPGGSKSRIAEVVSLELLPEAPTSSSTISFPRSEADEGVPAPQVRAIPHLPFRRISKPTAPALAHRQSVASVASTDAALENGVAHAAWRKFPESSARKAKKKDAARRDDETRETKRYKVITEFLDTEKAYVQGLDLIYDVSRSYPLRGDI